MPKVYLGDAVYVDTTMYGAITLTTEDGYRTTNTIHLEPEVWAALKQYVDPHNTVDDPKTWQEQALGFKMKLEKTARQLEKKERVDDGTNRMESISRDRR